MSSTDSEVPQHLESLNPLTPDEGVARYLKHRGSEITPNTKNEYKSELDRFADFCDQNEIENLNNLTGRDLDSYRCWRRDESTEGESSLSTKTMRDVMYLLRDFVEYLSSIEAVSSRLPGKVVVPELADDDGVRNTELDPERLNQIVDHLAKHEYASREHVLWTLLGVTGRRLGGIHSLDLRDLYLDTDDPYVEFRHDPPRTRLKNAVRGEGPTNIGQETVDVLRSYVEHNRRGVETETGREPLLTTYNGRVSKSTMRKWVYKWSRPCAIGKSCPHGRDPNECTAAVDRDSMSKCPSSRSPHSIRHTYITQKRRDGVPKEILSDRCDVSEEILDKHYDERTPEEKRKRRKKILEELSEDENEGDLL
jgi:site-specific recombinase XerD